MLDYVLHTIHYNTIVHESMHKQKLDEIKQNINVT